MDQVDPGNKYAVPYFWGINTLAIKKTKWPKRWAVMRCRPTNGIWYSTPNTRPSSKSCGIKLLSTAPPSKFRWRSTISVTLNSENGDDLKAAVDMMKKCAPM